MAWMRIGDWVSLKSEKSMYLNPTERRLSIGRERITWRFKTVQLPNSLEKQKLARNHDEFLETMVNKVS